MARYKLEKDTLLNKLVAVPKYLKLLRKCNTLETENEWLKDNIKEQLYSDRTKLIEITNINETLIKENERLREKLDLLKQKYEIVYRWKIKRCIYD